MRAANRRRAQAALAAALAICATAAGAAEERLGPGAAPPPAAGEQQRYSGCLALARKAPKRAHDAALAWREEGGGDAALHCVALALLGMGKHEAAARQLEALSDAVAEGEGRARLRAELLGQAGNAWLIAGRPGAAEAALGRALALAPGNAALLVDRGVALVSQGKFWPALDDLNRALESEPDRLDALVFRAAAWRGAGSLELAEQDADRAIALDPDNFDALLERGAIRKAMGNEAGARADWLRVTERAAEGPLREAARRNLEEMDVKAR